MDKAAILIAEDDLFLQQIYRRSLEGAGYAVDVAMDGKQTLDMLSQGKWDLLLLDLNLPEISGLDVLRKMNEGGMLEKTPVIVLTNFTEEEYADKCLKMGAKAYFTKSNLSFDEILMKIRSTLSQNINTDALTEKTKKRQIAKDKLISSSKKPVAADSAEGTEAPKSSAAKILVVEDDPFLSEIYKQNLSERGYQVQAVPTGRDALSLIELDSAWNIILLDLLMPDVDGFTVLERLKEKQISDKIPVIVLTNLSQENDKKKAFALGAVDFAIKSELSFDEIVARVENVLNKKPGTSS